jgi:hypothetical protein
VDRAYKEKKLYRSEYVCVCFWQLRKEGELFPLLSGLRSIVNLFSTFIEAEIEAKGNGL